MAWIWNFHTMFYFVVAYFKLNFNSIAHSDGKLWIVKLWKLDVCGRLLFANPVTYKIPISTTWHSICYYSYTICYTSSSQNRDLICNRICKLPASSSCLGSFYDPYSSFLNYQFLHYLVLYYKWCSSVSYSSVKSTNIAVNWVVLFTTVY